ncbi:hypothetical protein [Cyanobium sp. HWJ4-Hawea]|uniref:hypothetical protein n=1 Tax=Cyanobium sp. HWJ4-Hawea TaxID=2823713 RepID=UPI0020CEB058|nr:hypothetical protein [Cyanobium sp. HWJ4-Hawea]
MVVLTRAGAMRWRNDAANLPYGAPRGGECEGLDTCPSYRPGRDWGWQSPYRHLAS